MKNRTFGVSPSDYLLFEKKPSCWEWGVPCRIEEDGNIGFSQSVNQKAICIANTNENSNGAKIVDAVSLKGARKLLVNNASIGQVELITSHARQIDEVHLFVDEFDQADAINSLLAEAYCNQINSIGIYVPGHSMSLLERWGRFEHVNSIALGVAVGDVLLSDHAELLSQCNPLQSFRLCILETDVPDENLCLAWFENYLQVLAQAINQLRSGCLKKLQIESLDWLTVPAKHFLVALSTNIKAQLERIGIVQFLIDLESASELSQLLQKGKLKHLNLNQSVFEDSSSVDSILDEAHNLTRLSIANVNLKSTSYVKPVTETRQESLRNTTGLEYIDLSESHFGDACLSKLMELVGSSTAYLDLNNTEMTADARMCLAERLVVADKLQHINLAFQDADEILSKIAVQNHDLSFLGLRGVVINDNLLNCLKERFPKGVEIVLVGDNSGVRDAWSILDYLNVTCVSSASSIGMADNRVYQSVEQLNLIPEIIERKHVNVLKQSFPNLKYIVGLSEQEFFVEAKIEFISVHYLTNQTPFEYIEMICSSVL